MSSVIFITSLTGSVTSAAAAKVDIREKARASGKVRIRSNPAVGERFGRTLIRQYGLARAIIRRSEGAAISRIKSRL
ncbi:DNA-binding transcriptional regulator LsrR (DeoR family) [Neorhizobium sp. 2083]|uniref:hypothetical protein n=1 Tax=Neorhizobium sp. 2083 TaxID=2817762 RepID=UPI002865DC53|nr:hypothetical protein [Neorhizobium sp. 2083]MDR6819053.1 DNA-binding transcriptional regulator LsrR (DeoR family) [Neorhizobium sp. 2083]